MSAIRFSRFVLGTVALVFFNGCATGSSFVKKPEIGGVKRIAIVSVTAPQRVPRQGGKGEVSGWSDSNRASVADHALAAYEAEFKKLGWEVLPAAQVAALPAYQDNFSTKLSKSDSGVGKIMNTLGSMSAQGTYFSPTGLSPVVWEEASGKNGTMTLDLGNLSTTKQKSLKQKMQELAKAAGVDAAVLVQADYCYKDAEVHVGKVGSGTGSAALTGASALYAVTPQGVEVIRMKPIRKPCSGERRVTSDSRTAMLKGMLLFNDQKILAMFHEVSRKSASENAQALRKAMKD